MENDEHELRQWHALPIWVIRPPSSRRDWYRLDELEYGEGAASSDRSREAFWNWVESQPEILDRTMRKPYIDGVFVRERDMAILLELARRYFQG